ELVHTIQQSPHQVKAKSNNNSVQLSTTPEIGRNHIQRQFTFGPPFLFKGTPIHTEVLPMFVRVNTDLFIEAPIPGAKKMVRKELEKRGFADFYKAKNTIGVRYENDAFTFMNAPRVQWGGGDYNHEENASPVAGKCGSGVEICRLNKAPRR